MSKNEKKQLFNDSDEDDDDARKLKINKSYAQRYDEWREAEIKRKLEDRYGNLDEQLSSSSSDDDDPQDLEKALSKDFFEVISQLRKKDPKIYNPEVRFFDEENQPSTSQEKKKKDKPIYLRDYERKLIVERGGVLSDDESDTETPKRPASPSLAEKERSLKESLSKIVHSDSDDDDSGLLTKKVKTAEEKKKEEDDYLEWLCGRKEELQDKSLQESLSHLKEEWTNPNLDDGEKFLRDYILNKRYLGGEDEDADTGNVTDEDYQDEYMDDFERKYNFRFEEPDSEFLKRYPRTIDSSVRKKDDRRKRHRDEVKKRKEEEKLRQREELKVLKSLKRKEILKKIEKIKEITGNTELGISDKDLEEDYDPEEHDRRMNELFNDDYYKEGDEEMGLEELPLPPLEDDLVDDYENWDEYEGGETEEPYCEDPDFIMDCDYDPEAARLAKEAQPKSSRERRKLKRQSRFGTLVRKKKPEFDPNEKSFQQYVDEYYGIDYEDIVGGQPCRFKYRKVVPNSFGLTIEEILAADDKELNAWVSIKKATALRPDHVELNEKKIYEMKAQNEALKRKILPSLYKHETENNEESDDRPRSKKKKKIFGAEDSVNPADEAVYNEDKPRSKQEKKSLGGENLNDTVSPEIREETEDKPRSKKKKKKKSLVGENVNDAVSPEIREETEDKPRSKKKKSLGGENADDDAAHTEIADESEVKLRSKKKKKSLGGEDIVFDALSGGFDEEYEDKSCFKKKKKKESLGGEVEDSDVVNPGMNEENESRANSKKKKKKTDRESFLSSGDDTMANESPKEKNAVITTSEDDGVLNVSSKKKKNKKGQKTSAETEEGGNVDTAPSEGREQNQNQPQKLGRRQKKKLKKNLKNPAPNNSVGSSDNINKPKVGKKRPAKAMDESTSDISLRSSPQSKNTKQGSEESSQQSKRRKLNNDITGKSKKNFPQNVKQSKSSNQKQNSVSQNTIPKTGKVKTRRGKDRKKLYLLQKYADRGPQNDEAANKARAVRSHNNKPAPVLGSMSDSRLKAYGLNPKKIKNKLKYA